MIILKDDIRVRNTNIKMADRAKIGGKVKRCASKKFLKWTIMVITKPRLAHIGCVKRLSSYVHEEKRTVFRIFFENFVRDLRISFDAFGKVLCVHEFPELVEIDFVVFAFEHQVPFVSNWIKSELITSPQPLCCKTI